MFPYRFVVLGGVLLAVFGSVVLWLAMLGSAPTAQAAPMPPTEFRVCPTNGAYSPTIQAAVDAAQAGDVIKVAAGAYTEVKVIDLYTYNLYITKSVQLFGGYTCANWTTRNYTVNVTTLRPTAPSVAVVTIEGPYGNAPALTPTVDGFTITGGRSDNHGGGLRMNDSDALIRNNVITNNTAYLLGGGVWVQRGAPYFENNRIENNISDGFGGFAQGGGIQLEGTRATLINNLIVSNVVSSAVGSGGGVDIVGGGPVTLIGNTILSNTGAITGTGYGGGISIQGVTVTLSNNLIQGNRANSATAGYGGGIYVANTLAFTLTGNTVLSNTAGFALGSGPRLLGGGILINSSQGLLTDNTFTGNRANRYSIFGNGGGLAALTSTVTIRGGVITGNSVSLNCEGYGGGLYALNTQVTLDATRLENNCAANTPFYGLGGGAAFINSPYTLTNALILNNYAFPNDTSVGGLYASANSPGWLVNNTIVNNRGQGLRIGAALTLTNNIIMSHTTGISLTAAVSVSATYNNFYANITHTLGFIFDFSNIVINPQLATNFHLRLTSPLIDAGTRTNAPVNDFDDEPRPMAGSSGFFRVDIGADEFTGPIQHIINVDAGGADFTLIGPGNPNANSNGPNDYIGYAVLGADINGDGKADLMVSAEDWAEDFNNPPLATGRLYGLFNFGTRLTGTVDLLTDTASLTVVSQLLLQHIGAALVSGDLNADGKNDLIFGSYQDDGAGNGAVTPTVFALWGGPALAGARTLTNATPADFMVRAPGQNFFSFSAKNALTTGDLNGDGLADLVIGDGLADNGATANTGAVFVLFGGSGLNGLHDLSATPADYTLYGATANAELKYAALGRVNADAQTDLVVRTDTTAYVNFGPLTGISATTASAAVTITGLQFGGVIIMDLTGDGQADVILGSGDKLYVVPGPLSAETFNVVTRAVLTLTNVSAESLAVGQVSGDVRPDLIIGAPSLKRAFVLPAGLTVSGTISILDLAPTIVQGSAQNLGYDVAVGDLDLDDRPDLIVSTWRQDVGAHPNKFEDAGVVYVIYSDTEVEPTTWRLYLPLVRR